MKLEGVEPDTLTSASIAHDTTVDTVGSSGATISVSLEPNNPIPSDGFVSVYFPLQPVSGDHNVNNPTCTDLLGNLGTSLACSYDETT